MKVPSVAVEDHSFEEFLNQVNEKSSYENYILLYGDRFIINFSFLNQTSASQDYIKDFISSTVFAHFKIFP